MPGEVAICRRINRADSAGPDAAMVEVGVEERDGPSAGIAAVAGFTQVTMRRQTVPTLLPTWSGVSLSQKWPPSSFQTSLFVEEGHHLALLFSVDAAHAQMVVFRKLATR